ncbi:MAG: hypothetical protein RR037_00775 [Alistipes sp.]
MKKLLYALCVASFALFCGCSEKEELIPIPPTPGEITYTLRADKTNVAVAEKVTFNVTSSLGLDVTSHCTMCSNVSCFSGNSTSFAEAGTYTVEAHYQNGDPFYFPLGLPVPNIVTITVR